MKIKLIVKDENDRRILQNAEATARRVAQWPAWKRNALEESSDEQPAAPVNGDKEAT